MLEAWLQAHLGKRVGLMYAGGPVVGKLERFDADWAVVTGDEGMSLCGRLRDVLFVQELPSAKAASLVRAVPGGSGRAH